MSAMEGYQSRRTALFRRRLRQFSLRQIIRRIVAFVRHLPALWPLLWAVRGSALHRLLARRPGTLKIVFAPYLAANWDVRTRLSRIVDHCNIVQAIGGVVDVRPDDVVDLIQLTAVDPRYRITLDQPAWFFSEGPLVISLWDGIDRIFSLGFCLATEGGRRVAFVGGIQGRSEDNVLERYRRFSKEACGMRPRDFLVEVFKMFCRALKVTHVRAVADHNHFSRRSLRAEKAHLKISYDEVWRERGGVYDGKGFFILPVEARRRPDHEMPARKRTVYRKRYAMLSQIDAELESALCPAGATRWGYIG